MLGLNLARNTYNSEDVRGFFNSYMQMQAFYMEIMAHIFYNLLLTIVRYYIV
jgi:hypothetical protein